MTFIVWSPNGRCHGNQLIFAPKIHLSDTIFTLCIGISK